MVKGQLVNEICDILYAPSQRQDNTSSESLAGMTTAQWVHHEGYSNRGSSRRLRRAPYDGSF